MPNTLQILTQLLQKDQRLVVDGNLAKNKIIELALQLDAGILKLLKSSLELRKIFFVEVEDILVFDKIKFQNFISNKQFFPNSFTQYKNKIGLMADRQYLANSGEVVLVWPYKDCISEGGQTQEDAKRKEIFWNEILASDEIDRLLTPKILTNFQKYDCGKEVVMTDISLNDNLIIKGNNLLSLYSLKEKYQGKIKLIYIDPPYNKNEEEKLGIEVVEVFSCLTEIKEKNKQPFTIFIQNQLDKEIKNLIKRHGEIRLELIKNSIKIEGVKVANIEEEENKFAISWGIPREINNFNCLIKNLKETIEKKNKKWEEREKKGYKDLERTAFWVVLKTAFITKIYNKINKEVILIGKEIQEEFIYLLLLEKVQENLRNTKIKLGFLIITFLNFYYSDKGSFLDSHDPLAKMKREKLKRKRIYPISKTDFWKHSLPDCFLKLVIPNLYIPVVNNKIVDLTGYILEERKKFEEKWKSDIIDINLWECEEIPSNFTLKIGKSYYKTNN